MFYGDDDRFSVRRLTGEDADNYEFLTSLAKRYSFVSLASFIITVVFVFKRLYGAAFLIWILGNVAGIMSVYYKNQASDIGDE